ncbi:MAG: DMT family transporter [Steroidobacteraceae bacterium]
MSTVAAAHRPERAGVLLAAAGAFGFAGKAVIIKLAYRYGVDAITLLMYRMLFSLPLFLIAAWWSGRGKPALSAREWGLLFGLAFAGYYLASLLDFLGLMYINASLERLLLYLAPTVVLAYSVVVSKTQVHPRQWLALAVSYAGVLLVFGHDLTVSGSHIALGASLVFASVISYSIYLIYSGEAVKRMGALRVTGVATSLASVLCIGQFLLLRPVSAAAVAPEVLWLSLLNATLCTFFPVLLVMLAIERVGPGVTAQVGMIGPVATIGLSVILLGEPFNAWMAAGTALVLLGIWMLPQRR